MMKLVKYNVLIVLLFIQVTTYAQFSFIDSKINYQGELLDNSVVANGLYDIQFELCFSDDPNHPLGCGDTVTVMEVEVVNGLFVISDLDFGDDVFTAPQYWIELSVRKSNNGDPFVVLNTRQKINAVPYALTALSSFNADKADSAETLAPNGATNGQYLKFDSNIGWAPSNLIVPVSPWTTNGTNIYYSQGNVGIGVVSPGAKLSINSTNINQNLIDFSFNGTSKVFVEATGKMGLGTTSPEATLDVNSNPSKSTAVFDGSTGMLIKFKESGVERGIIGSTSKIDDEDFGIEAVNNLTFVTNNTSKAIITTDGSMGVGNLSPQSQLDIDTNTLKSPIRVKINGSTKLYMSSGGKLGVGSGNPAAKLTINSVIGEDSFSVATENSSKFAIKDNGDTKQSVSSNGMLKYMLELSCNEAAHGGTALSKFYDGLITGVFVSVSDGDVGETGICNINFPSNFNIQSRYVIASANGRGNSGSGAKAVQCEASSPTTLQCFRYTTSTGLGATNIGKITVLIY